MKFTYASQFLQPPLGWIEEARVGCFLTSMKGKSGWSWVFPFYRWVDSSKTPIFYSCKVVLLRADIKNRRFCFIFPPPELWRDFSPVFAMRTYRPPGDTTHKNVGCRISGTPGGFHPQTCSQWAFMYSSLFPTLVLIYVGAPASASPSWRLVVIWFSDRSKNC
jgi:hypothetical protein